MLIVEQRAILEGMANKDCKAEIKQGKCAMCISEISVDMVKLAIEKAMYV